MEVVRAIVNANVLMPIIDLPWESKDKKVEVIILPVNDVENYRIVESKSLKGRLKKYANPTLQAQEVSAWTNHIAEKYATT